jgi:hypothetical protein
LTSLTSTVLLTRFLGELYTLLLTFHTHTLGPLPRTVSYLVFSWTDHGVGGDREDHVVGRQHSVVLRKGDDIRTV